MDLWISEIIPETVTNAALVFQTVTGYLGHISTMILYSNTFHDPVEIDAHSVHGGSVAVTCCL